MAEQQKKRSGLQQLAQVKTWQLVVLLVMLSFVAATFLRLNNIGMVERRDAVIAADKEGDDVTLERRLYDLQRYASSHMNAHTDRVPLDHKYRRDNERRKQQVEQQAAVATSPAFRQAAAVCDSQAKQHGWRWPNPQYTACIANELHKYPGGQQLIAEFQPLPEAPYYQTFHSPLWSSDFAGWSVLACLVLASVIVWRLLSALLLRALLRWRYKRL